MSVAEIDDFDVDRSIARSWAEFQTRLSEVISLIDESADLTICTAASNSDGVPFVRFRAPARDTVRAEAAGNATLNDDFQLQPAQLAAMEELGWQPPSAEPGGSAEYWVEGAQEDSDRLAALAVAALRDVYGVQHPVFLAPDQLAEVLQTAPTAIEEAVTGEVDEVSAVVPANRAHLDALVDAELTTIFGHAPLRDHEGDVAIRVGSAMLFLRTTADAREVRLFAPVVHDVAGRSRAAEVLNDLNVEARWVKFQLVRDRVFVTTSVQARPFVAAHLHQAVRIMSEIADSVDDELAVKLNGRTTFDGSSGSS
jgi:hypothetical protein